MKDLGGALETIKDMTPNAPLGENLDGTIKDVMEWERSNNAQVRPVRDDSGELIGYVRTCPNGETEERVLFYRADSE